MGSDAAVYVFDYERYRTELVPAAKQLLLTGEIAPWWQETVRAVAQKFGMSDYADAWITALTTRWDIDLEQYCTYLGPDLGVHARQSARVRATLQEDQRPTWEVRACPSPDCPIQHRCLFHRTHLTGREQAVEDFNQALAYGIAAHYVGEGQFVGRSWTPFAYQAYLAQIGVDADDPLHEFLDQLGQRGFVVGYLFANSDGVQGWLTPAETQALHSCLAGLPLPQYEATFPAMAVQMHAEQMRAKQIRPRQGHPAPGADHDTHWEALSLSFVRTVATTAAGLGQGLLWGNDLPTVSEMRSPGYSL
jgi:hypothetical protein